MTTCFFCSNSDQSQLTRLEIWRKDKYFTYCTDCYPKAEIKSREINQERKEDGELIKSRKTTNIKIFGNLPNEIQREVFGFLSNRVYIAIKFAPMLLDIRSAFKTKYTLIMETASKTRLLQEVRKVVEPRWLSGKMSRGDITQKFMSHLFAFNHYSIESLDYESIYDEDNDCEYASVLRTGINDATGEKGALTIPKIMGYLNRVKGMAMIMDSLKKKK